MKSKKRGVAVLLAALLAVPAMPAKAAEMPPSIGSYGTAVPGGASGYETAASGGAGSQETAASGGSGSEEENPAAAPGEAVSGETVDGQASESSGSADSQGAAAEEPGADVPGMDEGGGTGQEDTTGVLPDGSSGGNQETASGEVPGGNQETASDEVPGGNQETVSGEIPGTVSGEIAAAVPETGEESVVLSTGSEYVLIVNKSVSEKEEYADFSGIFLEDGSYTIRIPEEDPFFPYEVQFADPDFQDVQNLWFMTPDSTVEYGGHTFRVEADFTGAAVTQLSLNVAGDVIVLYPAEKEFGGAAPISLLPLKEVRLRGIDLTGYTPLELTEVSVDTVLTGDVALTDTDKILWTTEYAQVPDYQVIQKGSCVNLSYADRVQMIVGEADQLAGDNIRYIAQLDKSDAEKWLTPVFYTQDEGGKRTEVEVKRHYYHTAYGTDHGSRYEYGYERVYLTSKQGNVTEGYLALQMNLEEYGKTKFTSVRAFEGRHETAAEAMAAAEVTDQVFAQDMAAANAGYKMRRYYDEYVTLVSFDGQGNVTGCLPVELYYSNIEHGVSIVSLRNSAGEYVSSSSSVGRQDECEYWTRNLQAGNPANGMYFQSMRYYNDGEENNAAVTAAYVGLYSSIAEAAGAQAADIKDSLFGSGYQADYSQGVFFTIFIGEDGTEGQEVCKYNIKTVEREDTLDSSTNVWFNGLRDSEGHDVRSFLIQDSYGDSNFIVYLVDKEVDRSRLALEFGANDALKLYAAGSTTPEVSGESYHDFSGGPMQFTASAEDGENSKNYWVYIITGTSADGRLFMNSLIDESVDTRTENGIVYTSREMMLDYLYSYKHDIMLANMGSEALENLSAELVSDVVELDDYWTLKGKHELSGFDTTEGTTSYGKLSNLALLRFRKKADVADGTDITGTLTIKSGEAVLMVVTLTGTVGDPSITTTEIPEAVKYVPYGTMIQNSNKYSWNKVTYSLEGGALPGGMILKPNGELYGVPTEIGNFTFKVRMTNSHRDFGYHEREFTLAVNDNTDENVEKQTDPEYVLTNRVTYEYDSSMGNQLVVSQGVYGEFVDLWLDGVKLDRTADYTAESGSTRINIWEQTLAAGGEGTHTIGIEFRAADTGSLKKASQNYIFRVIEDSDDDEDPGRDDGSSSSDGQGTSDNSNSGGSGTVTSQNSGNGVSAPGGSSVIEYTVKRGDSLSKLARQFYGSSRSWRRIFKDNAGTIRDSSRIYPGQKLFITLGQGGSAAAGGTAAVKTDTPGTGLNKSYTVVSGDNLYKIARKTYGKGGRWNDIYQANKHIIADPKSIYAGQVLVLPEP